MPTIKPKSEEQVAFTPQATIVYRGGSGHPFKPGQKMTLPASHLAAISEADKAATERAAKTATAEKAREDLAAAEAEVKTADEEVS